MADGDFQTPGLEHGIKIGKPRCLSPGTGQVGFVSGGEVAEQSFTYKPRKGGDPGAQVGSFLRDLKTNTAHAGVHRKVEAGSLSLGCGCPGQGAGTLPGEDGGTDVLPDGQRVGIIRGGTQDQNGKTDARGAQLHGFQHGADAEEGALLFQQPGNGHRAVAIGVGLDNGHHRDVCLGGDGIYIRFNGAQVNFDPGIVKIHRVHSQLNSTAPKWASSAYSSTKVPSCKPPGY